MKFLKKRQNIILLIFILILAAFFRLWQIGSIPPGLYPDVAINGNDALTSLKTSQFKLFYPENNGREGLFIWLIALSFKIFGPALWSLKLVGALIGIFTVLGLYLLAKQLFNKNIALISSFFLAVSFWHINFSRIGFRAIMTPFFLVWAFYFLFKGIKIQRQKSVLYFILAGLFFGLGFYTYIAFRAAILILAVIFLLEIWRYWQKNKPLDRRLSGFFKNICLRGGWPRTKNSLVRGWRRWDIMFLVMILTILPLGMHFYRHPQDFIGRSSGVSVFAADSPLMELGKSALKTLAMFNFFGDWNWRHNYAGSPMLSRSVGILFVLGLILTIISLFGKKTAKFFYYNNNNTPIFLISWFLIMLLPAILTNEGLPHGLRSIGVIPVVYIFAALGLFWFVNGLKKLSRNHLFDIRLRKAAAFLTVFLFALILFQTALANFNEYFFKWAKNPNVPGAFRKDLVDLGNYLNGLPENIQKYVIVNEPGVPVPYPNGIPMPAQTIMFINHKTCARKPETCINYLKPEQINELEKSSLKSQIFVLLGDDKNIFNQLLQKRPDGKPRAFQGFILFEADKFTK